MVILQYICHRLWYVLPSIFVIDHVERLECRSNVVWTHARHLTHA